MCVDCMFRGNYMFEVHLFHTTLASIIQASSREYGFIPPNVAVGTSTNQFCFRLLAYPIRAPPDGHVISATPSG